MKREITQERLRELFAYCEATGYFYRKKSNGRGKAGKIAGTLSENGYRKIFVDYKGYRAHRLVWLYVHGTFPPSHIDHINGERDDNRISNIRLATNSENNQNRGKIAGASSKYMGVHWNKTLRYFVAEIALNGKRKHLGYFKNEEMAGNAYAAAKRETHAFQPTCRGPAYSGGLK